MAKSNKNILHILEMTLKEKKDFLDSFDSIYFDCDGVIWFVASFIPNTDKAVNALRDVGKKIKFVSNNSLRSDEEYMETLKKIGIRDVVDDDILHPAKTISYYIKTHLPDDAKIFSICGTTANELFQKNGINVKTLELESSLSSHAVLDRLHTYGEKMDAVIFDINLHVTYPQLALASLYLHENEKCALLVGGSDTSIAASKDVTLIGCSHFLDIIAEQTKNKPIVLGKPGHALRDVLKDINNIANPKRILFVGDSLHFDINFAKKSGFQSLLVLSGLTHKDDLLQAPLEERPDFYADSVGDFVTLLKDLKKI